MEKAFTPFHIGSCEIKNRFVMTACNLGWCEGGHVTQKVIDFYRERARGQVGLIVAGAAGVDPVIVNQKGMMQVCDDSFVSGLSRLASAVHNQGGRIFLQLMHAGAYARRQEHGGMEAVSPSGGTSRFTGEVSHELSEDEIEKIIQYFRDAAVRAKDAGFDGIELIGSAGYLISEFLSNATNKRQDKYGGCLENRCRFLLCVLEEICKACGEYPVMIRLSGSDFVDGGNGPEEFLTIASLISSKVDAFDITGGWHESSIPQITYNVPKGMYLYLAHELKKRAGVPVIGCNRLDAANALRAIRSGKVDAAGILRPLIADPNLVRKLEEGNERVILPCISCNQMCLDQIFSGKGLGCAINPFVGLEGHPFKKREYGKRILVVGAGISGLTYAAMVSDCNHVTIWEKTRDYGGVGSLVARIPYREDIRSYIEYLYEKCRRQGVRFEWHHEVEADEIRRAALDGSFDRVVIAAGSHKKKLEYPVHEDAVLLTAEECIDCETLPGRRIVIIGSGYRSVQTAQYCLAAPKTGDQELAFLERYQPDQKEFARNSMGWEESSVTILSPGKSVGAGFGKSTRWMMLSDVRSRGARIEENIRILKIGKDSVSYWKADGTTAEITADLIVACEGWIKNGRFSCFPEPETDNVIVIGDALKPTTIAGALREAFEAAYSTSI